MRSFIKYNEFIQIKRKRSVSYTEVNLGIIISPTLRSAASMTAMYNTSVEGGKDAAGEVSVVEEEEEKEEEEAP